jgi:threonine dehydrogenase-like Zn-dependent dehydrogenase
MYIHPVACFGRFPTYCTVQALTDAVDWEDLLYKVENLTIDPTIMLTHRFKIDDIAKGYYVQEKREKGLVKCFVETRFSARPAPDTPELTTL